MKRLGIVLGILFVALSIFSCSSSTEGKTDADGNKVDPKGNVVIPQAEMYIVVRKDDKFSFFLAVKIVSQEGNMVTVKLDTDTEIQVEAKMLKPARKAKFEEVFQEDTINLLFRGYYQVKDQAGVYHAFAAKEGDFNTKKIKIQDQTTQETVEVTVEDCIVEIK